MRLIDVDNFLKQYSNQVPGDTIDAIDLRLALLKEPKVDAIPIEWIDQYMNKFQLHGVTGDEYWILHSMLCAWEWEKENGK